MTIHITDRTEGLRHVVFIDRRKVLLRRSEFIMIARLAACHCTGDTLKAVDFYPIDPTVAHKYMHRLRRAVGREFIDSSDRKDGRAVYRLPARLRVRLDGSLRYIDDQPLRTELGLVKKEFFHD